MKVVIFVIYVLISSFGLYKIKVASTLLSFDFIAGMALFGSGFLLWLYILRSYPLSIAFPIAAGSLVFATQLFGVLVLREPFTMTHGLGIVLIVAGIALVSVNA